jgi:hypothetical protein
VIPLTGRCEEVRGDPRPPKSPCPQAGHPRTSRHQEINYTDALLEHAPLCYRLEDYN